MPMVPRAVVAMLACARLGAVHSVVFGGFAAPELAIRADDPRPKETVTSHRGIQPTRTVPYFPMVPRAPQLAEDTPSSGIVPAPGEHFPDETYPETPGTRWVDWDEAVSRAEPAAPVTVGAADPLYILYTSGTTGMPKGVVRDNGGHAVALAWSMWNIYGVRPG